ncbi:unnamed protein product [Rotaria sordida]|uniref:Uncharacterized protein n=1 Tax=Rotaria sordida TaxID=392033 RepID=A0A815QU38_9BILA|nr:unnamed protein product [Rotaria sordida]CAF1441118.1 unnamed protein product [Rotaria sordida]CAF1466884.1 unnamed protein product [Rotaria sordida]CAF1643845.1 unnamed protein product [Rotaria sordida]CAF3562702.1 unnamed protein product [Rotaria sordida]
MTLPSEARYDFVPTASIIALVFICVFILISLIGRCLALNQSTIRSAQSLDLVIYRAPPKANPPQQKPRSSADMQYGRDNNREQRKSFDDPVTPVPVQRGPKNL